MSKEPKIITIDDIDIKHETAKAYLVENLDGEDIWIPKSMCEYDDGEMQLPEWLAQKNGLI